MFMRLSAIVSVAALVASVVAAPNTFAVRQDPECATGTIMCCSDTTPTDDSTTAAMLKLYGVNPEEYPGLVGYECSPASVVGVGSGATCTQEPVCCNENTFGLISVGCSPIGVST